MLTATNPSAEQSTNIPSNYSLDDNELQEIQEENEEQLEVSEEDISEIEEYLAKDDIDPEDLKSKANKLIQLIKVKERDLLLAAQIGQSLLDANVSMQNQLKIMSEGQKLSTDSSNNGSSEMVSNVDNDNYFGTYSNNKSSRNNSVSFDEPIPNSNSMTNTISVEKLEQSLKQNEQQNSKRIVLLENLLDQLQNELSELQTMNRELEKEKRVLLEEKESSKKINEMSEKDTEKMIAQLFDNKNKLADTVNKLEIKKKVLENELLDAMNGGSMLQNEIKKWKHEAEDCNKYKELYEQELQRVSVLEASLNSYRDDIKMIKAAQMSLKRQSLNNLDIDDIDFVQSQEQLNNKIKLSEELDDSQGGESSSRSRRIHRRRIIHRSTQGDEADIEEEEIEESEITGHHSKNNGHHHHRRHSHYRHIHPISYNGNENDYCSVTPPNYDDNVVVLHGRINHIEDEEEEGAESKELVLRDKPCHKCGKIRVNRFNHPKNSRRSRSRVMRASAKRTAIRRKRYSALVPLKSTGEEDEDTNSLIRLRDNSGFMGIYNTCKQAIEKLDYSKTELTKSQSAWKFIQFWFAMLCIFIGCIVVSYRRVFQSTAQARQAKKRISK